MSKTYLTVRLSSLGDVLLTTGVMAYWHKIRRYRFIMLTRAGFADLFRGHPAVERVIPVQQNDLSLMQWWDLCHILKKKYQSMEIIDLHGNLRTMLLKHIWPQQTHTYAKLSFYRRLFALTGIKIAGKKLLQNNIPQRYATALESFPPDPSETTPRIYLSNTELLQAEQTLKNVSGTEGVIAIHPYATHETKTWPRQNWKTLTSSLDQAKIPWIIIGRSLNPLYPGDMRDLTNKTDIRQAASIIKKCSALVTADSGPMHIGSSTGTPVIALFGPTSREWGFYPCGPDDVVLEKKLPCRPCSLHGRSKIKCGVKCMENIQTEEVMIAIKRIL
ncbi:glycosyltransferase family 9 protein [Desulfonatronovibrio magnus]|uniref:glycosyltransferase family 9 protein n=1 Tax=Desulfonatronovibrio magnus TaxID=698827 RepID=UPI0006965B1F|nr:glycosyltransferase family 9 protein [Desulfonatronovibrio magnus]